MQERRTPPTVGAGGVPARTWWIATLFAIGSAGFALGSVPAYRAAVPASADSLTYFVASLFFTSAAALALVDVAGDRAARDVARRSEPAVTQHVRSVAWWAALVQLVGTVWFNVMTLRALATDLTADAADRYVWRPDVFGSVCFLVSSAMAWALVAHVHRRRSARGRVRGVFVRDLSWWVAGTNLAGAIAFGVSAVAAFTLPRSGEVVDFRIDDGGTFVGAVCFFVAAVLSVPATRQQQRRSVGGARGGTRTLTTEVGGF